MGMIGGTGGGFDTTKFNPDFLSETNQDTSGAWVEKVNIESFGYLIKMVGYATANGDSMGIRVTIDEGTATEKIIEVDRLGSGTGQSDITLKPDYAYLDSTFDTVALTPIPYTDLSQVAGSIFLFSCGVLRFNNSLKIEIKAAQAGTGNFWSAQWGDLL